MRIFSAVLVFIVLSACSVDNEFPEKTFNPELPTHFPDFPEHLKNSITKSKIELGKKLFFDKRLSSDNLVSCASCHQPQQAFAENKSISTGVNQLPGIRNAQPLFNLAWSSRFFRDGGVLNLNLVALAPIQAKHEMNLTIPQLIDKLNSEPEYSFLFKKAYGKSPDLNGFLDALAAYQLTLISSNSDYDNFIQGKANFDEQTLHGMQLFYSDSTFCYKCHSGVLFTNQGFENNGLYLHYPDSGRMRVTTLPADRGKFKVPSLRNLNYTAPYMFDGSINSLSEVIEHYNSGGKGHQNQSEWIKPLYLSEKQKFALLRFLETLNDSKFVNQHP
jgi:cytochrome c peroxidase